MQAKDFLEALLPGIETQGAFIEQRALRGGRPRVDFAADVDSAIAFYERVRHTHDAFFGIAARSRRGRGGKADLAFAGALWADIDAPDAEARLLVSGLPPATILVATGTPGHLQAYWLLNQAQDLRMPEDIAGLEARLRGIRDACGADNTVDASRLFRMPGSLNWKHNPPRPVEVVRYCPELRYNLDDFPEDDDPHEGVADLEPLEPRAEIWVPGWIRTILDEGYEAGDCWPDPRTGLIDESAQDWKIVNSLRERGFTASETLYHVLNAPAIGRRKRYWRDYWRRTVAKAYQGANQP